MITKLPIAIVIPHTGLAIPPELEGRIALTDEQVFNEADAYTDMLYDFREQVAQWHVFPYARAILDVNRPREPHSQTQAGDDFVKHLTSYGATVYKEGHEPDASLEEHLFDTYWQPWHDTMSAISQDESIKLVFDCHSMAAYSMGTGRYYGNSSVRPRIAVCNLGDTDGEQRTDGKPISASPELTRLAANTFGATFADTDDFAEVSAPIAINKPYSGGPIIWLHGGKAQPWLMVELSRATYIGKQTGDSPIAPPNTERIDLIKAKLWQAITLIVNQL